MKPLDPSKQYTLDGMPVKILGTRQPRAATFATLIAAVQDSEGHWHLMDRQLDGTAFPWASVHAKDIIEVPETKKLDFWINVYPHGPGFQHRSRAQAQDESADRPYTRIACLHVVREYKVGEGLS